MGSTNKRQARRLSTMIFLTAMVSASGIVQATESGTSHSNWRPASDAELRSIWARGFTDRLFNHPSAYLAGGNAVTILGDMAVLLNPFLGFLDADTQFTNVVYDPNNPSTIAASDGSVFVRLPKSIGEISFRNIHVSGNSGASFGDITLRGVDFGGTVVKVTYRP